MLKLLTLKIVYTNGDIVVIANRFLSSVVWRPLAGLSYGFYITSIIVTAYRLFSIRQTTTLSPENMVGFLNILVLLQALLTVNYLSVPDNSVRCSGLLLPLVHDSRHGAAADEKLSPDFNTLEAVVRSEHPHDHH